MRLPIVGLLFLHAALVVAAAQTTPPLDEIRSLVADGRFQQALVRIDDYLSGKPGDAQARFLKGIALTEQNELDAAIAVFSALATDFPELPEPHNNLAVLYAARGEYVKARDALILAINTHPSYATAHENLGDIYAKMAGLAYDKALQLDRKNETAKTKLALMHNLISVANNPPKGASVVAAITEMSPVAEPQPAPEADIQVPTQPLPEVSNALQDEVMQTLSAWVDAWTSQDVDAYLSYYGREFLPPDGASRAAWEASRRTRLTKPQFIRVTVDDPSVDLLGADRARITFFQNYQSDSFGDRVRKSIGMVLEADAWRIQSEQTIE